MQPFRNSDKNKLLNFASGNKALGYGTNIDDDTQHRKLSILSPSLDFLAQRKNSPLREEKVINFVEGSKQYNKTLSSRTAERVIFDNISWSRFECV